MPRFGRKSRKNLETCDERLQKVFNEVDNGNGKPKVIIANTVKGKGCSIMEHNPEWHYWQGMTEEQIEQTRKELKEK